MHTCDSQEQTIALAYHLGSQFAGGVAGSGSDLFFDGLSERPPIICLFGELGAGKTTFIKGFVAGVGGEESQIVNSPTFMYLNIYKGNRIIYHFDLYRLQSSDEFLSMGFDEMLFGDGISCIEWSERIERLLPPNCMRIFITHVSENVRQIRMNV